MSDAIHIVHSTALDNMQEECIELQIECAGRLLHAYKDNPEERHVHLQALHQLLARMQDELDMPIYELGLNKN